MEASLAATGMLDVLATRAVLFMMLSGFPSTSMVSCHNTWTLIAIAIALIIQPYRNTQKLSLPSSQNHYRTRVKHARNVTTVMTEQ